jgi:tetratricopeptide (TPR) repeat protein
MSETPSENTIDSTEKLFQEALAKHKAGDIQSAGPLYIGVLKAAPDHLGAHNNLALLLQAIGRSKEAIPHLERVLEKKPDHPVTLTNLGNALRGMGALDKAYATYSRVLSSSPDDAKTHNNLGAVRSAQNRHKEAISHYQKAVEIQPDYAEAHNNLGNAFQGIGNLKDAMTHYQTALSCKDDYFSAHANLGIALQAAGRIDEAIHHFQTALSLRPNATAVHRHLALVAPEKIDISYIENLLIQENITEDDAINLRFTLGTVFKAQDQHDLAFKHFEIANQKVRLTIPYDHKQHIDYIDRIIDVFKDIKVSVGLESNLPVFIVGMPRSGTSLIEQILSSHPQVHGGGELEYFADVKSLLSTAPNAELQYPEGVVELGEEAIQSMAQIYLDELSALSSEAIRMTDKMPSNFLSLGLIQRLFPQARFIHCRRDPLDTCVSIYFQYFTGHHPYAYDLTELGQYYQQYQRLMSHWHSLFPEQIMAVQYEELVHDQETVSRKMIDFVGLEWDERCLEFHRNERPVRSASNLQVRKPLYTDSVNQWRKYEKHLQLLQDALTPT